ncbi:unnamed protein product [Caenorhabditis sp. 36 PRJEB53466]|nr:unnamed protein product [Caenorhabditis sp. 36 PRJEB53466]
MAKLREEQKAELIKQEKERRRIARLRQVRQQSSLHAKVIREVVSQKKREIIEDIRAELHEEVRSKVSELEDVENLTPKLVRKSTTPRSKKKHNARRREMTENDVILAQKRNAEAMKRLKKQKEQEKMEKEEKLAKRKAAAQKANEIMRGGNSRIL